MTKRDRLHRWLMRHGDWAYLKEIPFEQFGMSRAGCSTAMRNLCDSGRADFRVVGYKQYRAKPGSTPVMGPKPSKGLR